MHRICSAASHCGALAFHHQLWLEAQLTRMMPATGKATCEQFYGAPGHQLCQVAKDWKADLIVIGSRGRSSLSEILLGSVSNYVVHHATCSVLVVYSKAGSREASHDREVSHGKIDALISISALRRLG